MRASVARVGTAIALLLAVLPPHAARSQQVVRPTERPFLYRIEGSPASYLYGTIHVPDERVLALPRSVRLAVERAEVLAPELQIDASTQQALAAGLSLPPGRTLRSVLPAELYARLERLLAAHQLPIATFERVKPLALGAQLEVLDYLKSRFPPLDVQLMQRFRERGKPIEALETPEEQIAALDALTLSEQVEVLDEELARLERLTPVELRPVEKMVRAYVAGDEKALWAESMAYVDPSNPIHAKFIDALFTRRNARLAERIEARLAAKPARSQLVAIGALHLFGPEGVIARLEKRGRMLVRLDGNATP